jgi:hypothetical protein
MENVQKLYEAQEELRLERLEQSDAQKRIEIVRRCKVEGAAEQQRKHWREVYAGAGFHVSEYVANAEMTTDRTCLGMGGVVHVTAQSNMQETPSHQPKNCYHMGIMNCAILMLDLMYNMLLTIPIVMRESTQDLHTILQVAKVTGMSLVELAGLMLMDVVTILADAERAEVGAGPLMIVASCSPTGTPKKDNTTWYKLFSMLSCGYWLVFGKESESLVKKFEARLSDRRLTTKSTFRASLTEIIGNPTNTIRKVGYLQTINAALRDNVRERAAYMTLEQGLSMIVKAVSQYITGENGGFPTAVQETYRDLMNVPISDMMRTDQDPKEKHGIWAEAQIYEAAGQYFAMAEEVRSVLNGVMHLVREIPGGEAEMIVDGQPKGGKLLRREITMFLSKRYGPFAFEAKRDSEPSTSASSSRMSGVDVGRKATMGLEKEEPRPFTMGRRPDTGMTPDGPPMSFLVFKSACRAAWATIIGGEKTLAHLLARVSMTMGGGQQTVRQAQLALADYKEYSQTASDYWRYIEGQVVRIGVDCGTSPEGTAKAIWLRTKGMDWVDMRAFESLSDEMHKLVYYQAATIKISRTCTEWWFGSFMGLPIEELQLYGYLVMTLAIDDIVVKAAHLMQTFLFAVHAVAGHNTPTPKVHILPRAMEKALLGSSLRSTDHIQHSINNELLTESSSKIQMWTTISQIANGLGSALYFDGSTAQIWVTSMVEGARKNDDDMLALKCIVESLPRVTDYIIGNGRDLGILGLHTAQVARNSRSPSAVLMALPNTLEVARDHARRTLRIIGGIVQMLYVRLIEEMQAANVEIDTSGESDGSGCTDVREDQEQTRPSRCRELWIQRLCEQHHHNNMENGYKEIIEKNSFYIRTMTQVDGARVHCRSMTGIARQIHGELNAVQYGHIHPSSIADELRWNWWKERAWSIIDMHTYLTVHLPNWNHFCEARTVRSASYWETEKQTRIPVPELAMHLWLDMAGIANGVDDVWKQVNILVMNIVQPFMREAQFVKGKYMETERDATPAETPHTPASYNRGTERIVRSLQIDIPKAPNMEQARARSLQSQMEYRTRLLLASEEESSSISPAFEQEVDVLKSIIGSQQQFQEERNPNTRLLRDQANGIANVLRELIIELEAIEVYGDGILEMAMLLVSEPEVKSRLLERINKNEFSVNVKEAQTRMNVIALKAQLLAERI